MNGLRITLAAGVAAAMALVCMPAQADEQSGFALGVRTGYGVPMGSAKSGTTLASLDGGMIPFWLDLGYRFSPNFYLGGFFQYGLTFPPTHLCPAGGSCDGYDLKGGIDFQYHFMPSHTFDPWAGLGVGYEVSRVFETSASFDESSAIYHGLQFLDVQLGADLHCSKLVPFGPFIDLSFGQFSKETLKDATGTSSDIPMSSTMHEWLTLGVRGQFNL
jgi:outer membrane protein